MHVYIYVYVCVYIHVSARGVADPVDRQERRGGAVQGRTAGTDHLLLDHIEWYYRCMYISFVLSIYLSIYLSICRNSSRWSRGSLRASRGGKLRRSEARQFHMQTLIIYQLVLNQNYYTSAVILLANIVLCSKVQWIKFIDYKCFHMRLLQRLMALCMVCAALLPFLSSI